MNHQQTNIELIAALAERLGETLIAEQVRARQIASAPDQPQPDDPTWESPQEACRRRQLEGKINKITGILNYRKIDYSSAPEVPDFAQMRATPEGRRRYGKALEIRLKALEALYYPIELDRAQNTAANVIGRESQNRPDHGHECSASSSSPCKIMIG